MKETERYKCLWTGVDYRNYQIVYYIDQYSYDKVKAYNVNGESDIFWHDIEKAKLEIDRLIEKGNGDMISLQFSKKELNLINNAIDNYILDIENDMENGNFIEADSSISEDTKKALELIYNYIYERKEQLR